MAKAALLLLLALVCAQLALVFSITVNDECLDASWANKAIDNFEGLFTGFPLVNTKSSIESFLSILAGVFDMSKSQYRLGLYTLDASGNFYGAYDCNAYPSSSACPNEGGLIATVINPAFFGDSLRRYFRVDASHSVNINGSALRTITYDPTSRPWYSVPNGEWSDPYGDFNTGLSTQSLVVGFDGGKLVADRDSSEPCSFCLNNKDAVPIATSVAQQITVDGESIDTMAEVNSLLSTMYEVMKAAASQYTYSVYVGFTNGDAYFVINCNRSVDTKPEECGTDFQWYADVKNVRLLGDAKRHSFALNSAGRIVGSEVDVSAEDFPTTERPWFSVNGWTAPYPFFESNIESRSFTVRTGAGTVSTDMNLAASPCSLQSAESGFCSSCCDDSQGENGEGSTTHMNFIFDGMIPASGSCCAL